MDIINVKSCDNNSVIDLMNVTCNDGTADIFNDSNDTDKLFQKRFGYNFKRYYL